MHIVKITEVPEKEANIPLFTGGRVTFQRLVGKDMGKDFNILMVNFAKGARNKFHTHTTDQVLIVSAGKGIVATEKEQRAWGRATSPSSPPARSTGTGPPETPPFSHIALEPQGSQLTQLEE